MINSICRVIFYKILGWRLIGAPPNDKKYLFAVIPHTSNWDFIYGWLAIRSLNLNVTIFVKDSYYVFGLKTVCKFFGVAPVNRRARTNFVDAVAAQYQEKESLAALLTPEGTRKFSPEIKSGYYYLAKKANIPIVVAGPNYPQKSFTILPPRPPMETFEQDAEDLISFSKTMVGKNPDQGFQ